MRVHRFTGAIVAAAASIALLACGEPSAPAESSPRLLADVEQSSGARLLPCPSSGSSASAVIGSLGGTLSGSQTRLDVPEGAVSTSLLFSAERVAGDVLLVRLRAGSQEHATFAQPVTVTLDYSSCPAPPTDAQLYAVYVDEATGAVLETFQGTDDRAARRFTFQTGHFSGYAIAY